MRRHASFAAALAVLVLFAVAPHPLSAATADLATATRVMAKNVAEVLEALDMHEVSIGQFTSPPQLVASGGPGIAKEIGDELVKLNIAVTRRAKLGLTGRYLQAEEEGRPVVRILGELVDANGRTHQSFEQTVGADDSVANTLGLTFAAPADAPPASRARRIQQAIDDPTAHLRGQLIRATADSPYGIAVSVDDELVTPTLDEGLPFFPIGQGQRYAITLVNASPYDAAISLHVDGLSVFAFSENGEFEHFILPARSTYVVRGWHRNNETSDAFLVTGYAKSAVAELLTDRAAIGTITATFKAAWPVGGVAPQDEIVTRGGDDLATSRGPAVAAQFREVQRHIGRVRAAVSVRYAKP